MNVMGNSNIHKQIMGEYRILKEQREAKIRQLTGEMYMRFPRIREIDDEISRLTVRYAKMVANGEFTPEQAVDKMNKNKNALMKERDRIVLENNIELPQSVEYVCDKCKDEGLIDGEPCICYLKKLRTIMQDSAKKISNLAYNANNDTFSDFNLNYYSKNINPEYGVSPYENMKSIYAECVNFASKFTQNDKNNPKNLYFYGASGLGKTFLSNCISNYLISHGISVIYQTSYKLFQFLEDYKFGKINRSEYSFVYDSIYDCDLLIIDDLGTEFITSYTCSVFFDVLNTRLMNGKKMIISTNLRLNETEKLYSQRVYSRIIGEFNVLGFFGEDIRQLKNNREE